MALWLLLFSALFLDAPARPTAFTGATLVDGNGGPPVAKAVGVPARR